jgi:uncharacterized protein (DUF58 family)
LLFVMLEAGLNYTNSLALLLTFTLAGYALVGMHECHRTLQGLTISHAQAQDCHAGDAGVLELHLASSARVARRALVLRCGDATPTSFEMAATSQLAVRLEFTAPRRGRLALERLALATTAPFGLFRCWTWMHLPVTAIVYPRSEGWRPLPLAGRSTRNSTVAVGAEEDQWASLRPYQPGDSLRSIAWKAYARGAPLMVSQYEGSGGGEYLLTFAGLESLDLEARLCQLTAWVVECARMGASCALQLPGLELPFGNTAQHRTLLLRALAVHGEVAP